VDVDVGGCGRQDCIAITLMLFSATRCPVEFGRPGADSLPAAGSLGFARVASM
jgi:hypothetical protein